MSNGTDIASITATWLTHSGTEPLSFSPDSAGLLTLIPPIAASDLAHHSDWGYGWTWHGYGNLVQIKNVGTAAGNYVLNANPITLGVCQQINQMLFGDPSIPTITSDVNSWSDEHPTNASNDPAVDGKQEGCFTDSLYHVYQYYKVILVQ